MNIFWFTFDLQWNRAWFAMVKKLCNFWNIKSNCSDWQSPNPARTVTTTGTTFQINSTKRYVLVVTLPINDTINFLESIKQGFKGTALWNKYKSEITRQPKNNKLDYVINLAFRNIYRLFILSFENGNNNPIRDSSDKHYMSLVEITDFNVLIEKKKFFFWSTSTKQTSMVWKSCRNVKKRRLYNRKLIGLFESPKLL